MKLSNKAKELISELNRYDALLQQGQSLYIESLIDEKCGKEINKELLETASKMINASKPYTQTLKTLCKQLNEDYKNLINKPVNIAYSWKHNNTNKQQIDNTVNIMFRGFTIFHYGGHNKQLIFPYVSSKNYDGTWTTLFCEGIVPDISHVVDIYE